MQLERLDHVGIAVADLAAARRVYEDALGLVAVHEAVLDDQGVHEVLFQLGDAYVQLVAPLGPDTPVGRFLARRGEGLHHVGYAVADVAGALKELRASGVEVVDQEPRIGSHGTTIAFVHPRAVRGVLIELVQDATGDQGGRGGREA